MSESPKFLVGVGISQSPSVPDQDYKSLYTRFNIPGLGGSSDKDFYNKIVREPPPKDWSDRNFDIYGFMGGECRYAYEYSIRYIADFFQKHQDIKVVICDMLIEHDIFKQQKYIQPQRENSVPFFIRKSVLSDINFQDQNDPLGHQLKILKQKHTIFHIESPLISKVEKSSG